ncbi:CEPU-1-like 2 [Homarus americanus]|uniref:CEPU-1-like 2 n=1 Tax=Homarus americanus TaxID=6706 RepID=A0A8J5JG02_HOMAM|nr:CEPU-1-like 2 [Homarus americanus]
MALESVHGTNLTLENVSRNQMGAYLCIASNKVPPSVSKRIIVNVNWCFGGTDWLGVWVRAPMRHPSVLSRHLLHTHPAPPRHFAPSKLQQASRKYRLEEMTDSYRVTMKLVIKNFTKGDAGQYKCISTNSLGKAETSIRLYEIVLPTQRQNSPDSDKNPHGRVMVLTQRNNFLALEKTFHALVIFPELR